MPTDGFEKLHVAMELFGYCTIRHDGREPFTAQEIIAKCQLLEIDLLPIEAKMMMDLSQHFVGNYSKYDEDDQALNPYDPFADEDEEDDE